MRNSVSTYYLLFRQHGNTAEIAEASPTEAVDGGTLSGIRAMCLFTSAEKAEVYRKSLEAYADFKIQQLPYVMAYQTVREAVGFGFTHVSLDPGAVLMDTQPIEIFIETMPLRAMPGDEPKKRF